MFSFKRECYFLILICACFSGCNSSNKSNLPNILIIVADDLGYHDLGITGSSFYETPNIDALANRSIQFTNAYSSSPVCSPARASIMTGQFPSRHGITDWIGALTNEEWRSHNRHTKMLPATNTDVMTASHITLPEAMQSAGYKTFIAGKWHIGGFGSTPEDHGFETNIGAWERGSPVGGFYDPYENPKLPNRSPGEALSFRLADETADYIKEHENSDTKQPFFAYLSFYAVHSPLQTSKEKWKKYRDKADSLGITETGFEMGNYIPVRNVQDHPVYAGLLETMDEAVGYLLNELDSLNLAEDTIIIFTSDNGGVSSGDHFSTTNYPFRAGKGSTYEGGIRVPFFLSVPGLTNDGLISETPIIATDIYPTLLDFSGQPLLPKQHIDGKSLLPILNNGHFEDRALIWHYPHYSNQDGHPTGAIRKGDWKLIVNYESTEKELFNLSLDISESKNLIDIYPEKADILYSLLMSHFEETGALFPTIDPYYDPVKSEERRENQRNRRIPNLENQRRNFLSPDFNPNNNWWGSQKQDLIQKN